MSNLFIGLGALNAFIAVAVGAFAAHKLKVMLAADQLAVIVRVKPLPDHQEPAVGTQRRRTEKAAKFAGGVFHVGLPE